MSNLAELWDVKKQLSYVDQLYLMDSPKTVITIWILYMMFVFKIGPTFMKNRPAYELQNIIMIYNVLQVFASAYIVVKGVPLLWQGVMPKCVYNSNDAVSYLTTFHVYFLTKITELLDTIFFIFRKKYKQASFLHIYHHSYMLINIWVYLKYDTSFAGLLPAVLNATVHVIMYTYYGLATFPGLRKYLWWKRYITNGQLIQFLLVTVHMLRSYHLAECPPTFMMTYSLVFNMVFFTALFLDFYFKSYKIKD